MLNDDRYHEWIRTRRQVTVDSEFSERVMKRIARRYDRPRRPWTTVAARMSERPWARAAVLAVATVLGVGRVLVMLHVMLFA
jgi:hypothetical protein